MRQKYVLIMIYLFSLSGVKSAIDFSTSGTGYTVSGDVVTISGGGAYDLENSETNKKIIVSKSCTLNLNTFSLKNDGSLTPILISESQTLTLVLTGKSTLQDSATNELDGVIYLQKGASLLISGTGSLELTPKKLMGINGTDSTSLTVNDGATLNIYSTSSNGGGIYLKSSIIFNNANYIYNGRKNGIDSEGTIKLIKGGYSMTCESGKGIQSENELFFGEENGKIEDIYLGIKTNDIGIKAKKIEIYSGRIAIESIGDGISVDSSDCDGNVKCSGNCACSLTYKGGSMGILSKEDGIDANGDIKISGGLIYIFSGIYSDNKPIDQDGLLEITGGSVLAAGASSTGRVIAKTSQKAKIYTGRILGGGDLIASETSGTKIIAITVPKTIYYLYFNHANDFVITLDGTQLTLTEPSSGQDEQPGSGNPTHGSGDDDNDEPVVIKTNGHFIKRLNILMLISLLIF